MAATQHYIDAQRNSSNLARPVRELGIGGFVRLFTRLIGVALMAASLGLWIAPGTSSMPELLLMKLCISFFLALTGLHLIFASRRPKTPE